MTLTRLVYGGNPNLREQTIGTYADPGLATTALVEGWSNAEAGLTSSGNLQVIRMAPGCPCCSGNLTMRVTLNRVLRAAPSVLFFSLADASHVASVRNFLQEQQYCDRLELGSDLDCGPAN